MDIKSIKIKLVRKGGFSKPYYSITIQGDGKVVYEGFENVDVKGTVEDRIKEEKILDLFNELKNSDFFSIQDNFNVDKTINQPVVNVSFIYRDKNGIIKKKEILHYLHDPEVPMELKKIENKIDKITDSYRWIYRGKKNKRDLEENKNIRDSYKRKKAVIGVFFIVIAFILLAVFLSSGFFQFNTETDINNGININDEIEEENNNTKNKFGYPEFLFITTSNQSFRENNNRSQEKSVFNQGDNVFVDFEFKNITHNKTYNLTVNINVKKGEERYYRESNSYYSNDTTGDVYFLIYDFITNKSWPSSSYDELYFVNISIHDNVSNKSNYEVTFFYLLNNKSSKWVSDTLESAILGGNYLINATSNGVFMYEYDPISDTKSNSYNILRHAGTIYSMLQLYDITKNKKLLTDAEKAIDFLLLLEKPFEDNSTCIVYNDEVKLGGAGLTIIALAEHAKVTGENTYITNMQNLAKYIKISQYESGKFISKRYYSSGEIENWDSQYYPGEAILGLCRLYSLDNNETWLDVAEKGSQYLINLRKNIPTNDLVHDHWLMMALNELYRYRDNTSYFNHCIRLAKSIMNAQRDKVNQILEYPEWLGSYYTPPRSTPTATRSEGLIAAYHLSNDFGKQKITKDILNSIKLAIKFQLQTQFTLDNIENLPNPQKALGGFHESLTDYNIRIDYVQHNICSMLGLYEILKE